jgi:hypothetical protein
LPGLRPELCSVFASVKRHRLPENPIGTEVRIEQNVDGFDEVEVQK